MSSPCGLYTFAELKQIFRAPVTVSRPTEFGCYLTAGSTFIPIGVYQSLSLQDQISSDSGAKKRTILGHPGAAATSGYLIVSFGKSATSEGIVKIFCASDEQDIGMKLIPKLLNKYKTN